MAMESRARAVERLDSDPCTVPERHRGDLVGGSDRRHADRARQTAMVFLEFPLNDGSGRHSLAVNLHEPIVDQQTCHEPLIHQTHRILAGQARSALLATLEEAK